MNIFFSPAEKSLRIEMHSLEITSKDLRFIYEEGYSGDYAQLAGKSGKGIGMNRVQKLLGLNNVEIKIERNIYGFKTIVSKQVSYQRNAFTLLF